MTIAALKLLDNKTLCSCSVRNFSCAGSGWVSVGAGGALGLRAMLGALERGASAGQVNVGVNLAMALIVQPLWMLDRPDVPNAPLWQPLSCSLIFFLHIHIELNT